MVITAVVKLLLEDKICTSWRKAIGEESERRGARSWNGWPKKGRRAELRGGGFDNCNPLPSRDISCGG